MRNSIITMTLLLLFFYSCKSHDNNSSHSKKIDELSFSKNNHNVNNSSFEISKKRKIELKNDFSNFSQFKENINTYRIKLDAISGNYSDASIVCQKSHFDREKEFYVGNFHQSGLEAKFDLSLNDNDPLDVEFECRVMDQEVEIESFKIHLRKSLVISGIKNPYSIGLGFGPIDLLVFDEDSILLTEGVHLKIQAREIISKNGKIITFTEEGQSKNIDNQHGISGGLIDVETETSIGKLEVELRGKNGGRQTRVPETIKKMPPKDSTLNGNCGGYVDEHHSINDQKCFGKVGRNGYKGLKGFDGLNGGSSGAFFYKANKRDDLKLKVEYFPGKGSSGGVGGLGGKGGPGGIGSTLKYFRDSDHRGSSAHKSISLDSNHTHKFPDGKQGPRGETGDYGNKGQDGNYEDSIIHYLVDEMKISFNNNWQSN